MSTNEEHQDKPGNSEDPLPGLVACVIFFGICLLGSVIGAFIAPHIIITLVSAISAIAFSLVLLFVVLDRDSRLHLWPAITSMYSRYHEWRLRQELTAYLYHRSLTSTIAQDILASPGSFRLKREVAALIADGMDQEDAMALIKPLEEPRNSNDPPSS